MKKLFAILAVMGVLTLGSVQPVMAQDAAPAQTEQTTEAAVVEEGGGLHKELKTKFIEGDASFMSLVAIALVLGLAFCIERIIYLSLAEINTKKFLAAIEAALEKGDVDLIAFGVPYIANPDLVERMQNNWPLAESDRTTYYGVSGSPEKGYTDYPNYEVK